MPPRTRFAPSPTGLLHVGGVRTALFNRLFAKNKGGAFILRIEDTDAARSSKEHENSIMRDLSWLGLEWDEGPGKEGAFSPYRQSERLGIYLDYSKKLVDNGSAYLCYCSKERLEELKAARLKKGLPPRYDGRCRNGRPGGAPANAAAAIRFKASGDKIEFDDMVHGRLSFDGADIGDFIIIGSDSVATYNFAAAIDDYLMKITHVIRGDDHLSNTPRQIMILNALGLAPPSYGHIPLVLSKNKTPLSKRDAALSVAALRESGYMKEAVLNSVARLGWSPRLRGVETPVKDLLTLSEMEILFNASTLSKSPSVFDEESLKKYNRDAIASALPENIYDSIAPEFKDMPKEKLVPAITVARNGAETTIEVSRRLKEVFASPVFTENAKMLLNEERSKKILAALAEEVRKIENMDDASWKTALEGLKKTGEKGKALFMPIRTALTGSAEGMDIESIVKILGKDEILKRLKHGENP